MGSCGRFYPLENCNDTFSPISVELHVVHSVLSRLLHWHITLHPLHSQENSWHGKSALMQYQQEPACLEWEDAPRRLFLLLEIFGVRGWIWCWKHRNELMGFLEIKILVKQLLCWYGMTMYFQETRLEQNWTFQKMTSDSSLFPNEVSTSTLGTAVLPANPVLLHESWQVGCL